MLQLAGTDLTRYFPMPLNLACQQLNVSSKIANIQANGTAAWPQAVHTSGALQTNNNTALNDPDWYTNTLQPKLKGFYKGYFVFDRKDVAAQGEGDTSTKWAIYKNKVYDISDYFATVTQNAGSSGTDMPNYSYLNKDLTSLFQQSPGQDITKQMDEVLMGLSAEESAANLECLNNAYYFGDTDFRKTAKCLVQNYLLLSFSVIIMLTIVVKCKSHI